MVVACAWGSFQLVCTELTALRLMSSTKQARHERIAPTFHHMPFLLAGQPIRDQTLVAKEDASRMAKTLLPLLDDWMFLVAGVGI